MKKFVHGMIFMLALIVIGGITILFFVNEDDPSVEPESTTKSNITKKTEVTTDLVYGELKSLGKLITYEYLYTGVQKIETHKELFKVNIPFTKYESIFSYDGRVEAGIDFEKITVEKNDQGIIVVTIPKAEIMSTSLDDNSFQLYEEDKGTFSSLSVEDTQQAYASLKSDAEKKALKAGILDKAEENARNLVGSLLNGIYATSGEEINYVIK